MRTILAIAKKELTVYLTTPWAYVITTFVLVVTSIFFLSLLQTFKLVHERMRIQQAMGQGSWDFAPPDWQAFRNLTEGVVVNLWGVMVVITLFVVAFLASRLFAEERKQKTFELLMTTPVTSTQIVLGKYLGALGIAFLTFGSTIIFPIILSIFGSSESGRALDWNTVLLGYFGILLFAAFGMAVGLFISSLTESTIVAGIVSFVVLLVFVITRSIAPAAEEPWKSVLQYLSVDAQLQNLLKGVLDLKPLVYFVSLIVVFLMLTHRSVESQRWS